MVCLVSNTEAHICLAVNMQKLNLQFSTKLFFVHIPKNELQDVNS